jgi:hypothetical protein
VERTTPALQYWLGRCRILAFIAYAAVGSTLLSSDVDFEVTPFTIFFQGIGYLLMIGVANVCYSLGPFSERVIRPSDPQRFRLVCYRLGFWFSVPLQFSVSGLLTVSALFHLY